MCKTVKQWICLMLSAMLVFSAAAGMAEDSAPADAAKATRIQKAVAEGGARALWELIGARYATGMYQEEGCAELYIWSPDNPSFPDRNTTDAHLLNFCTIGIQETAGVGFTVEHMILFTFGPDGSCTDTEYPLPDGPMHIDPYNGVSYKVSVPAYESGNYEVFAAAGTDDNGHELEFYGVVRLLNAPEALSAVPENPDYDTENLRYEADFQFQVADGVWWVPVRSLGDSRYTNREIAGMVDHSPEQKQEEISTLYEAVQLFQISGFSSSEDNVKILEDGLYWEHHKPGYDAVRTNTGCCATCADWLSYILSGDYEQMGFIGWSWPDGNGHVFNYIFQDGWYYFIDLTHYEGGMMTMETGNMPAYRYTEYPAGSLHKTKDPEKYVKYYLQTISDPPAEFRLFQAENVIPSAVEDVDGQITIYYPEGYDFRSIDGVDPEKLDIRFARGPEKTYRWAGLKNAAFKVKKKYLGTAEEAAAEPLTAYRPGDRLTLTDNIGKGTAVIDGIKYITARREEVHLGFEASLQLYGEQINGVFDYRLPLGLHGEALEGMDSLALGDLTVDVVRAVPEVQVVLCIREGDCLTVQEVMDGKYYDSRHVGMRKDENGSWTETPDYWYLIITKDRKTKYEFGRFHCGVSDEF